MVRGWTRLIWALGAFTSVGLLAVIYVKAALPIIDMGTGSGQLTGTFSTNITQVEQAVPTIVALLLLGIVLYLLIAGVRDERAVQRRPPR